MKNLLTALLFIAFFIVISNFAFSATIYVKHDASGSNNGTSWANAFTSFQSALNAATSGDDIWVAGGTYKPTSDYGLGGGARFNHFRMINNVGIYGGFAGTETLLSQRNISNNETILSGDIGTIGDNTDNCYHVFYHPSGLGLTSSAILDGFTIQYGYANGTSEHSRGGGIHNNSSSPLLNNLIIKNNFSPNHGGGLYNLGSAPNVTNSTIEYNTAHWGGGVFNGGSSSPILTNVIIQHNQATSGGGGIYSITNSSPTLTNALIANNSASGNGGGIENSSSASVTLVNVTIVNNTATNGGGIFCISTATSVIRNSIIWGNNAPSQGHQIYTDGCIINIFYSNYKNTSDDVEIKNTGEVNPDANTIFVDPNFVDPDNEDYRLFSSSASVNTGNNSFNLVSTDLRGQQRIQNTTIDMGAYEWTSGVDPECTNPTSGGTIASAQTLCYDSTPNQLVNSSSPTGFAGNLEYKWQSSIVDPGDIDFDENDWEDIPNSNSTSYQPGELSVTNWYRRLSRVDCELDWSQAASSNILQITISSCDCFVSNYSELTSALSNNICKTIKFTADITAPNRLFIEKSLTLNGQGNSLIFSSGELIIRPQVFTNNIQVYLTDIEIKVHNPIWYQPASAYGIVVRRGTLYADNIVVDLAYNNTSTWAAPAGITTSWVTPAQATQGHVAVANVTNSTIKVHSKTYGPYGIYASSGSSFTATNNSFDLSLDRDPSLGYFAFAFGGENNLENGALGTYPILDLQDNTFTGTAPTHSMLVYMNDWEDASQYSAAQSIICQVISDNSELPQIGYLMSVDEYRLQYPNSGEIDDNGEIICIGVAPSEIIGTEQAIGQAINITYKWQYSNIDPDNVDFEEGDWLDILNSNTEDYTPSSDLSLTTWFRRLAKDNTCINSFTPSTGVWKVKVLQNEVFLSDDYDSDTDGWGETHFDNLTDAMNGTCGSEPTINISNYTHTGNIDMTGYTYIVDDGDFLHDGNLSDGLIQTTGTGRLIQTAVQNTPRTFPVTDGTNNFTVTITPTSGSTSGVLGVKLNTGKEVEGTLVSPMTFWDIYGEEDLDATVVLRIDKAALGTTSIPENGIIRFWNGSRYQPIPTERVSIVEHDTYYIITITNMNYFNNPIID